MLPSVTRRLTPAAQSSRHAAPPPPPRPRCPPSHPQLLLTEAALAPRAHRELAAQLVFESLGAPAAHFALPAALTLYAAGVTTGLVVDCGEGATSVVPVYEGRVLDAAVQRVELAGRDVTDALRGHLRRAVYDSGAVDGDALGGSSSSSSSGGGGAAASRAGGGGSHRYYGGALGPTAGSSAELELVRELKEAACFVRPRGGGGGVVGGGDGGQARAAAAAHVGDAPGGDEFYSLPDGQRVRLAREARALSAEVLFAPRALLGSEAPSVPEAVALALGGSPLELREALLASVHVAGGTTCMRGFGQRLLEELRAVTPQGARIRISAPAARAHSAWIGGSIFASLGTFREALVTKAQYDECGAGALAAGSRGHR